MKCAWMCMEVYEAVWGAPTRAPYVHALLQVAILGSECHSIWI